MTLHTWMLLAPLALIGCTTSPDGNGKTEEAPVDSDGDGLIDSDELAFGTDTMQLDTDGDGLSDRDEYDLGTSGTEMDSDGDGYGDGDEVTEGADPTDASSLIYTGGWPYYSGKDSIDDPGMDKKAGEGKILARFVGPDQFGEDVDIYDYAGHGKLTVIDLSGIWCYYCNEMAKWMEGRRSFLDDYASSYPFVEALPEMVANGDVQWVTVLDSDVNGQSIEVDEQMGWATDYENDKIAVLGDVDMVLQGYFKVVGYPTLMVVDENMEIVKYDKNDYFQALEYAYENAGQ